MAGNGVMDVKITVRDDETGKESPFWLSDAWGYDDENVYAIVPGAGDDFGGDCGGKDVVDLTRFLFSGDGPFSLVGAEMTLRTEESNPS